MKLNYLLTHTHTHTEQGSVFLCNTTLQIGVIHTFSQQGVWLSRLTGGWVEALRGASQLHLYACVKVTGEADWLHVRNYCHVLLSRNKAWSCILFSWVFWIHFFTFYPHLWEETWYWDKTKRIEWTDHPALQPFIYRKLWYNLKDQYKNLRSSNLHNALFPLNNTISFCLFIAQ